MNLHRLYHKRRARCSECGCRISSIGVPLGSIFVLDKNGNYYCMHCDDRFEDGDERIYDEEIDNEERFN